MRSPQLADIVAHRRPEVIFHLAAQLDVRVSVAKPLFDAEINVLGSLNVCEAALAAGTRKVVFAGSGGTLYGVPESLPVRESHPQRPISPYGVSKKAAGDYLHYYREVRGLEYTELALANVYGPAPGPQRRSGRRRDLRRAACSRAASRPSTATARRRATTCSSTTSSTRSCAPPRRAAGCSMNIGTGVETSVLELYEAMARLTGLRRAGRTARPSGRASSRGRRSTRAGPRSTSAGSRGPTLDDGLAAHHRLVPHPRRLTASLHQRKLREVVEGDRRARTADVRGIGHADHAPWRGGATRGRGASASRAASGQKIGAATQHDA